jgi:hypothetical protein
MRILLIDDKVPDPSFGAGFPRAYRLLLSLVQLGHQVVFYPTNKVLLTELNHRSLNDNNIEVVDEIKNAGKIDLAILSRPHNIHYHLNTVRKFHPESKVIYDTEALWYRRYDLQMAITGKLPWWAYRYDELGLAKQVDMCFVVNAEEKRILEENGVQKVRILAHALDVNNIGEEFEKRKNFLVVGGILEADSSNEDALWYYMNHAWQEVEQESKAVLRVTGHRHSERLLNHELSGVQLAGLVNDLVPLYGSHRVFIAATRFATGIPWKVHESMANGLPCVISELLADQLGAKHEADCLVARSPSEWVSNSLRLYQDKDLWNTIREGGFAMIRRDCEPSRFKKIIQESLGELF